MEETDAQLHLKKRARRRLVGAIAFVTLVAVVLPMLMDQEPRQAVQDVEIRIPGQDEKPFAPKFAAAPAEKPAAEARPAPAAAQRRTVEPSAKVVELLADKPAGKPAEKSADKPADKPAEKPAEKSASKPAESEAKRAAAILAGAGEPAVGKGGEQVILIGAFTNDANVRNLKAKLGEQGIKIYTEPLDTPQGKKTRVRAGPFPNREAADKALAKMKRIGVSGVVTAKQ